MSPVFVVQWRSKVTNVLDSNNIKNIAQTTFAKAKAPILINKCFWIFFLSVLRLVFSEHFSYTPCNKKDSEKQIASWTIMA